MTRKGSAKRIKSGVSRRLNTDQGYGGKVATSGKEGFKLQEAVMKFPDQKVAQFMKKLEDSAENMMETPQTGTLRPF